MTNPLFKRDGTGKVHYYYNSHLGQPLKLFDKAGKVTWAARSQAFGETEVVVAETENALRFPGQYWDGETGLHYNYFRDYDPETGRYFQRDPIGLGGGLNFYQYGYQNPIAYYDNLGLFSSKMLCANPAHAAACTAAGMGGRAATRTRAPAVPAAGDVPGDPCKELREEINAKKNELKRRHRQMKEDRNYLYENRPNGSDSWAGHRKKYKNVQREFRDLLDLAKELGCDVESDDALWSSRPAPSRPDRYNW